MRDDETANPMMKTVTVQFRNVGPKKLSWSATLAWPLTYRVLKQEIRRHQALMSFDIEFAEDGSIYVGVVRKVGEWSVES